MFNDLSLNWLYIRLNVYLFCKLHQTKTNRKKSHCKKKKNVSMEKVVCFLSYKISLVFRFRVKREKKTQ